MKRILCYGSLNTDCIFTVPHIVRPGETIAGLSYRTAPGGKGANQSIAAARAGACVFHAGKVGRGGEFWKELLEKNAIDTSFLVEDFEREGGRALIQLDDATGENAIVLDPGTNHALTLEEIDRALANFSGGDYLMLQNEVNHTGELIRRGAARGMHVVFTPAPMSGEVKNFDLKSLAVLALNEHEGAALTGGSSPEKIMEKLSVLAPETEIVLTLGHAGALCRSCGKMFRREAFAVPRVRDTTAAGDTFAGYYTAARALDCPVETALCFSAAAAALCVTRAGAIPSIPKCEEVENFLRSC